MDERIFSSIKGVKDEKEIEESPEEVGFFAKLKSLFNIRKVVKDYDERLGDAVERLLAVERDNESLKSEVFDLKKRNKRLFEEMQIKKDESQ